MSEAAHRRRLRVILLLSMLLFLTIATNFYYTQFGSLPLRYLFSVILFAATFLVLLIDEMLGRLGQH